MVVKTNQAFFASGGAIGPSVAEGVASSVIFEGFEVFLVKADASANSSLCALFVGGDETKSGALSWNSGVLMAYSLCIAMTVNLNLHSTKDFEWVCTKLDKVVISVA
ncbi:hypothetical protein LOK49_LG08G00032 [Camellia lanceoleosa]|uniref:Uncharacterized protein n=1 Tax=Camellia lanceoleosa TaxID=1840588 RepID=A0ACC0GVX5_9ERIC|nr:hypothetical protein LOK49_LG08G00032 [Camellia lanceoleosa]